MNKLTFPKNKFTAISGLQGSGMTLTAVAILAEMSKGKVCPRIVTNIHLKNIKHSPFTEERLFDHKDSIIFIDAADFYLNHKTEKLYFAFIKRLGARGNTFVIAGQGLPNFLIPSIRKLIHLWIISFYNPNNDRLDLTLYPSLKKTASIHIPNASQYFEFYDTLEIPIKHKLLRT